MNGTAKRIRTTANFCNGIMYDLFITEIKNTKKKQILIIFMDNEKMKYNKIGVNRRMRFTP